MTTGHSSTGIPAGERAEARRRGRRRPRRRAPSSRAARSQPGRHQPAPARAAAARPRARACSCVLDGRRSSARFPERDTARARRARPSGNSAKVFGIRSAKPGWRYAFGVDDRLAHVLLERLAGLLAPTRRARRGSARSARSAPAASNTWQPPQPWRSNTEAPWFSPPASFSRRLLRAARRSNVGLLHHLDLRAHQRVAEAAELGADDRVGADLRRRDRELRQLAGDRVLLLPELGHPERVQHVERAHLEDRLSRSRGRRSIPADDLVRVLERPRELPRGHLDAQRVRAGARRSARARPRSRRRSRSRAPSGSPSTTISRPVWPWIGGPSLSSSGWARNFQTE